MSAWSICDTTWSWRWLKTSQMVSFDAKISQTVSFDAPSAGRKFVTLCSRSRKIKTATPVEATTREAAMSCLWCRAPCGIRSCAMDPDPRSRRDSTCTCRIQCAHTLHSASGKSRNCSTCLGDAATLLASTPPASAAASYTRGPPALLTRSESAWHSAPATPASTISALVPVCISVLVSRERERKGGRGREREGERQRERETQREKVCVRVFACVFMRARARIRHTTRV